MLIISNILFCFSYLSSAGSVLQMVDLLPNNARNQHRPCYAHRLDARGDIYAIAIGKGDLLIR